MPTKLFVERPTLVTAFLTFVLLVGLVAAATLTVQQFPNVDIPFVAVIVQYPGASAAEMRDSIVRPIEESLAGAPDLEHIQSTIQQGYATISAQFSLSSDKTGDLVEVQKRVQIAQSQLPQDLVSPTIATFDPSEYPVVTLSLSSAVLAPGELSALAAGKIIPAIEQAPGVGNVQTSGNVTPAIEVQVDPNRLSAAGATLNEVVSAISTNNVRAPGGIVYGARRETVVNVRGDVNSAPSVANLLLPVTQTTTAALSQMNAWSMSPRLLRVGDVATVTDAHEPARVYAYAEGQPTIVLQVQKAAGASDVATAKAVIAQLPGLRSLYPDVRVTLVANQAQSTQQQLDGVVHSLTEGIILVAIVMLLFLRSWRNSVVVLISMPASLLVTLAVMKLANFTLDMVSLMAMTLTIGILVDDSIVVLENIDRHHRQLKQGPREAALSGRLEIGFAAVVLTLVDVIVFLPIAFLPGIVGRFLSEFALVIVVATLASLVMSFTITPSLAGNWSLRSTWRAPRPIEAFGRGFERVHRFYLDRLLPAALARPVLVLAVAAVSLVGAIALVPLGVVGFEFIPAVDAGQINIQINYPTGTPLEQTRQTILAIERAVDPTPDVRTETAFAGSENAPTGGYLVDGAVGQVTVYLKDDRRHSTDYWVGEFRKIVGPIAAGANPLVIPASGMAGGTQQPLDYVITDAADDPERYAPQVYRALRDTRGATDVYSSASSLSPQVDITFNRQEAQALNVSVGTAATAVRAAFGGAQATQFQTPNGVKDVQVIYPVAFQHTLDEVLAIPLSTAAGATVHVGDIARLDYVQSAPIISRLDQREVVHVTASVSPGVPLSNVTREFTQRLKQLRLPRGVTVAPSSSGNQQNLQDTVTGIAAALTLSIVLVFLLMVALFNSYVSPFIIMFTVPLATAGALGALALTRSTLNLFSLIGTVLLIGLVSKNGILLVDFANLQRAKGLGRLAAVRAAASERFRPIVMTTFAMVFGMLPMALGLDTGGNLRAPLGIVVIGGLISSLLLSLVVIPIVYTRLNRRTVPGAPGGLPAGGPGEAPTGTTAPR